MTSDEYRFGVALLTLLDGNDLRHVMLSEKFVSADCLRKRICEMMQFRDPFSSLGAEDRAEAQKRICDPRPCWR